MVDNIWTVIRCDKAYDQLVRYIDSGMYAEAMKMHSTLLALNDKIKSDISFNGGFLLLGLYDRIIMLLPPTVAETLPNILDHYKQVLGNGIAVGLGLNLEEAAAAAQISNDSGQIEFFEEKFTKAEHPTGNVIVPEHSTNVFDPLTPTPTQPVNHEKPYKDFSFQSLEEEKQNENKLINAIMSTIGGAQIQQQMQQLQQVQQQPRNLVEALHGQRLPDQQQSTNQPEVTQKEEVATNPTGNEDSPHKDLDTNDKIALLLTMIKQHVPQIMGLADKNPEAFKHAMKVVDKVLHLSKNRDKLNKSEQKTLIDDIKDKIEDLNKNNPFRKFISKKHHYNYPVGTTIGRKKKVKINGKTVWRGVSSGEVMDNEGNAISVKSSNYRAEHPEKSKK